MPSSLVLLLCCFVLSTIAQRVVLQIPMTGYPELVLVDGHLIYYSSDGNIHIVNLTVDSNGAWSYNTTTVALPSNDSAVFSGVIYKHLAVISTSTSVYVVNSTGAMSPGKALPQESFILLLCATTSKQPSVFLSYSYANDSSHTTYNARLAKVNVDSGGVVLTETGPLFSYEVYDMVCGTNGVVVNGGDGNFYYWEHPREQWTYLEGASSSAGRGTYLDTGRFLFSTFNSNLISCNTSRCVYVTEAPNEQFTSVTKNTKYSKYFVSSDTTNDTLIYAADFSTGCTDCPLKFLLNTSKISRDLVSDDSLPYLVAVNEQYLSVIDPVLPISSLTAPSPGTLHVDTLVSFAFQLLDDLQLPLMFANLSYAPRIFLLSVVNESVPVGINISSITYSHSKQTFYFQYTPISTGSLEVFCDNTSIGKFNVTENDPESNTPLIIIIAVCCSVGGLLLLGIATYFAYPRIRIALGRSKPTSTGRKRIPSSAPHPEFRMSGFQSAPDQ